MEKLVIDLKNPEGFNTYLNSLNYDEKYEVLSAILCRYSDHDYEQEDEDNILTLLRSDLKVCDDISNYIETLSNDNRKAFYECQCNVEFTNLSQVKEEFETILDSIQKDFITNPTLEKLCDKVSIFNYKFENGDVFDLIVQFPVEYTLHDSNNNLLVKGYSEKGHAFITTLGFIIDFKREINNNI